jgi:tetratricopeptide (TPR) repeat protein
VPRNQLLLVVAALCLTIGLFYFGSRKTPTNASQQANGEGGETAGMPPMAAAMANKPFSPDSMLKVADQLNFEGIIEHVTKRLTPGQRDTLKRLNTQNQPNSATGWQNIANQWQNWMYPEISAYYLLRAAKTDTTKTNNWLAAGKALHDAMGITTDSLVFNFYLANAVNAYQKVLATNPADTAAKTGLALCYIEGFSEQSQQVMSCVFMLRDIVKQDSTNIKAQLALARMAMVSGQFDKAAARLQTITTMAPNNPQGWYLTADAQIALGNKQKAVEALENCKKLIKNPTFVAEIDKQIQSILKP